jgi:photosystem II stability/assembly factor-like uncharacterized protein
MDGIVKLDADAAGTWRATGHMLQTHHIESLMVIPETTVILAGTHHSGLHRSEDDGRTWERVGLHLGPTIFSLSQVREESSYSLYAGTEPAALFRSRDGGVTWRELGALRAVPSSSHWDFPAPPHIAHVKHVTADPRDSRILYVCVEQGALLKSENDGESFTDIIFDDPSYRLNRDAHRVVFCPEDPNEIYLDGGDGITRSMDAGRTWQRVTTPDMRVAYPDQLFISPDNSDVIFAVGGGTSPNIWRQTGSASAAIVRSDDRGKSWHHVGGGLPDGDAIRGNFEAASMVRWQDNFGFFVGSSDGEIFRSFDKGLTWKLLTSSVPPISKCVHYANLTMGRANIARSTQPG